jgi:glycosyltransferase involved in cell wall biosynthesis
MAADSRPRSYTGLGVPRVSVLLPVRDAAATLAESLASLHEQSLADHEVIAVEDGSRDESEAILAAAARDDPRLRVVSTPPRGLVAALNHALSLARAPLVARMDADDVAAPARLLAQAERLLAAPGPLVLGCRVRLLETPGCPAPGMEAYLRWSNALLDHASIVRDIFVESPLVHPSVMLETRLLRSLGGYRDEGGPEDYDLWLRALAAGVRFAKLPEELLLWRDSAGRLTRRDARYSPERFLARKLAALAAGPLQGGRPVVIWGAGPIGKSWAKALLADGHPVMAFVEVDPRKIGQRVSGVPVRGLDGLPVGQGPLHLAAVGQPGARDRIRQEAARRGLVDGRDLIAVA